jgi:flavin reductase ActVB
VTGEQEFKNAMSVLAGAVVMVTTYLEGRPWGLTISSCCAVTAEPPQVLISLRSSTVSCREILRSGGFGLSMLSAAQRPVAELGAAVGTPKFVEDYCEGDDTVQTGPPIAGALCHLGCSVVRTIAVGDHRLIVGLVREVRMRDDSQVADPLLYFDRGFRRLSPPAA